MVSCDINLQSVGAQASFVFYSGGFLLQYILDRFDQCWTLSDDPTLCIVCYHPLQEEPDRTVADTTTVECRVEGVNNSAGSFDEAESKREESK